VRLAPTTAAASVLTGTPLSAAAGPATAADGTYGARADFNGDGDGDGIDIGMGMGTGMGIVAFSASRSHVSGTKGAGRLVVLDVPVTMSP
jgi:hypothetical protein